MGKITDRQPSSCLGTSAANGSLGALRRSISQSRSGKAPLFLSLAVMMFSLIVHRGANGQVINYPNGFAGATTSASGGSGPIWLENQSTLTGTSIQLTSAAEHAANNIWYKTPVNVQGFTTTFTWTVTCPTNGTLCGDGMGFMIISDPNSTAAGFTYSGFSGGQFSWSQCQASPLTCPYINSVLVKFDLYNNQTSSEGNLTGFYSGGQFPQAPYNPQYDMAPYGINMQSGHLMRATLTYSGSTLTETVADTATGASYTKAYTGINIPSLVAGNVAYVGFGGGTGAAFVNQYLQSWTYSAVSPGQASSPTFSPAGGTYSASQSVKLSTTSSGSVICYSTTGQPATNNSNVCSTGTLYTGPLTVSSSETLYAVAGGAGYVNSPVASASYVIQAAGGASASSPLINYPNGFAGATTSASGGSGPIWLENQSTLTGTSIQLTSAAEHAANNIWYKTPVNVQGFTTTFTWTVTCPTNGTLCGDGMGFMIISDPNSTAAGFTYSGFSGGQFSWSQCQASPLTCPYINSILVKFDLYNNQTSSEGNLTGFYSGGQFPQAPYNPQYDMAPYGINMQSGHLMRATLTYSGSTLTETVADTATGASYTKAYTGIHIPTLVAGNVAYVGFGGGTGAAFVNQYLQSWTYTPQ